MSICPSVCLSVCLYVCVSVFRMLQREVHFLGHMVTENDLKSDSAKIEAVATWPEPQNLREVRSLDGLCAWYR